MAQCACIRFSKRPARGFVVAESRNQVGLIQPADAFGADIMVAKIATGEIDNDTRAPLRPRLKRGGDAQHRKLTASERSSGNYKVDALCTKGRARWTGRR